MTSDPEAISNHSLHAKLMVLESQFQDHAEKASCARRESSANFREINERLGKGEVRFALIERGISANTETLETINGKLDTLVASENQRKGRDGVLAALLNSKLVIWLFGICGTVGAWLWGSSHGGGS